MKETWFADFRQHKGIMRHSGKDANHVCEIVWRYETVSKGHFRKAVSGGPAIDPAIPGAVLNPILHR